MDREIIVKCLGEMTLTLCEMQDAINRLAKDNERLTGELAQHAPDHTADEVIADAGNVDDNGWS